MCGGQNASHQLQKTHFPTLLGAAGKICLQISLARRMNQSKWGKGKEEQISDKLQRECVLHYHLLLQPHKVAVISDNGGTGHKGDWWGESDFFPCTTLQPNQRWKTHLLLAVILLKMLTSKLFSATCLSCWFECSQDLWQLFIFAVPLQVA